MTTRAPRVGTQGTINPVGLFDLCDTRVTAHTGHTAKVVQPFGCPKNGTMGHMYVDCVTCDNEFVGLILISSFDKAASASKEGTK